MASLQLFSTLDQYAIKLERMVKANIFWYYGTIDHAYKQIFIEEIERLAKNSKYEKLYFFITTPGGSAEMTEVMVDVMRKFYKEVYFVVPDYAYSAGTILCMSGDKIFMNYYSSLGPIDPQVPVNGKFVSAQGYIDQFEMIKEKSKNGTISAIEAQMALNLNLADLNFYIQARNLTVSLLKKWLVQYKFKDWITHQTTNSPVTEKEKKERAEKIAHLLGDNSTWHSHGRHIGMKTLKNEVGLKIEDLGQTPELQKVIRDYHSLAIDLATQNHYSLFIHSKKSRR